MTIALPEGDFRDIRPPHVVTSNHAHSYNVRICHWINVIACGYLLVSGVHILLDFPELY